MSQTASKPQRPVRRQPTPVNVPSFTVSAYDRVASLVLSLLVLVGAVVLFLLAAWFSSKIFYFETVVPVVMEDLGGGGYENGIGTEGQQIEAPTESEIAAESDIVEEAVQDTLSVIVDASISSDGAADRFEMQFARDEGVRTGGRSEGTGKHPAKGSGGGSGGGARRDSTWEIRFPPGNTVESYAKALDFFGIELGIFGASDEVIYISRLSQPKPTMRTGLRSAEGRKYMTWSRGDLDEADLELFEKVGVKAEGRAILKFLPPETEQRLTALERQFKNKAPKDIRRTRFGVKPEGKDFAFFVIDQMYY